MTTVTPPRTTEKKPWPALWALVVGFFMILVDSTIVSVAEAESALRARAVALRAQRDEADEILGVVRAKDLPERYWLDVSYVRAMLTTQIEWLAATADRIAAGHISWDASVASADTTTNSKETTR